MPPSVRSAQRSTESPPPSGRRPDPEPLGDQLWPHRPARYRQMRQRRTGHHAALCCADGSSPQTRWPPSTSQARRQGSLAPLAHVLLHPLHALELAAQRHARLPAGGADEVAVQANPALAGVLVAYSLAGVAADRCCAHRFLIVVFSCSTCALPRRFSRLCSQARRPSRLPSLRIQRASHSCRQASL